MPTTRSTAHRGGAQDALHCLSRLQVAERAVVVGAENHHELVVITTDDRRPDHVRGGAALQAAALAGRVAGVAVRPVVHLVHWREWRAGLIERYGLAGFPQALAIVGAKGPVSTGPTAASTGHPHS